MEAGRGTGVVPPEEIIPADSVIAAPALPIVADLVESYGPSESVERLGCIRYPAGVYRYCTFDLDCSKHSLMQE